ncbi:hypothetical protein [Vibrio tetraodonis]|nr:hypothetical protein [Vibrio tetraodonis]
MSLVPCEIGQAGTVGLPLELEVKFPVLSLALALAAAIVATTDDG